MKAMVATQTGSPDVFEMQELDKPVPEAGEVLVKVHATSVNPADAGLRSGMFGAPPPMILGLDVSGVVEAVGAGVQGFQPGDEVYYALHPLNRKGGGCAEYNVEAASNIARKPANLTHTEAASVPVVGATAYAAVVEDTGVRLGDTVLVHGAAGGVGSMAVQLAKASGAYVFATCGSYDADLVRGLGADVVLDYRTDDVIDAVRQGTQNRGVDVVIDTSGKMLTESFPVLRSGGHGVVIAGVAGNINEAMRGGKSAHVHFIHPQDNRAKLEKLAVLFERGQIRPVVGKVLPLEQVAEAHRLMEQGGEALSGKVVLQVAPG